MDKRSWPWKKKYSDKQAAEKTAATASESSTAASDINVTQFDKAKQDNNKKPKYVQISLESYTHLTGLEDEVKSYAGQVLTLEEEVKELNEKLSEADTEMANKENLVKQHAKVAEEAVSGWEKAEAEAAALKNHLESVTLLKLTAEDRAAHLDDALKECMRQIRNLKEDHEEKLWELALNKTKLFDKMKLELEAKIGNLDQELMKSAAENAAWSRSLQERSNMLIQLNDEKSQANAEIELLKSEIESCEREVNTLKYELHIARKEAEIRNEEKNMSVRSAEAATKHHLEGVKKIAKLEAECQRLRGLVRKKLPGPAALAQMKLEVENFGRDSGESRLRRSPGKPSTPQLSQMPDFSLDHAQKYLQANELLTERLLAMEEETKMLKEALAKRNSELQAARSICAQTASKLQTLEAQLHDHGEQKNHLSSNPQVSIESFNSRKASIPSGLTTMSEDGNDDNISCSGSWTSGMMSDLSHQKKEKTLGSLQKSESVSHADLMNDFLEMEKLAYQSNGIVSGGDCSGNTVNEGSELVKCEVSVEVSTSEDTQLGEQHGLEPQAGPKEDPNVVSLQMHADPLVFVKLQSKISGVLELVSNERDMEKVIEEVRQAILEIHETLHDLSVYSFTEANCPVGTTTDQITEDAKLADTTATKETSVPQDASSSINTYEAINEEVQVAIMHIYDFITSLGKEVKTVTKASSDGDGLNKFFYIFSSKYGEAMTSYINLNDFVLDISQVLNSSSELHINVLGYKSSEVETGSSNCIDKIALPANKVVVESLRGSYPDGCAHFSDSASDPDVPNDGNLVPISESTVTSWKCSPEEFEQLKMDRDNLAVNLARSLENLETTKSQLLETEHLLAEVKSKLMTAQKSNSLAETQLKCMAESYNSLETRSEDIKTEVNFLQGKIQNLEKELLDEKRSHEEALNKCKDLQDQLERIDNCAAAQTVERSDQEKELAAAAEKLAKCQETIFLLGKQMKALRPQTEMHSSTNSRIQRVEDSIEEEPTISGMNLLDLDPPEIDTAASFHLHRAGSESPMDLFNASFSPSDFEANDLLRSPVGSKQPSHRPTKSGSSSASNTPTPEKHARGFSRFFSSKAKNVY
ncbi:filament-like plant protein 4 isoform X1 [Salvia splendens]|uniref:filament-like plant protein 4 isoform X1 n=2 Tax=Salvia splendens TaxID=180675 RepID=UPI001100D1BF|nr:filament-like plant protein 4 isoform X1 [Salvia splendens]XP_042032631.1 filament-like plant protein 4 isoform X1 [Salvia splendens]